MSRTAETSVDQVPRLPRWFIWLFAIQMALNGVTWIGVTLWQHYRLEVMEGRLERAKDEVKEYWRIDSRNMWREIDKLDDKED